jgi:hypothetical protein
LVSEPLVIVIEQVPELSALVWVIVMEPNASTVHAVDEPALYATPPVPSAQTGVMSTTSPGSAREALVIAPNEP